MFILSLSHGKGDWELLPLLLFAFGIVCFLL